VIRIGHAAALALTLAGGPSPHRGIVIDANCDVLGPDLVGRCEELVHNNVTYVVPALEDISGVKLETCYPELHFRFGDVSDPSAGAQASVDGTIHYSIEMARDWLTHDPPVLFDSHELLHLLYNCVHVPAGASFDHTFWDPVELELDRAIFARHPMAALARQIEIDRHEIGSSYDDLSAHPAMLARAHAIESYLLYGAYLRAPGRDLVRAFFDRLTHDPVLAASRIGHYDPRYERAYLGVVTDLARQYIDRSGSGAPAPRSSSALTNPPMTIAIVDR
jgi:hypothetical protein